MTPHVDESTRGVHVALIMVEALHKATRSSGSRGDAEDDCMSPSCTYSRENWSSLRWRSSGEVGSALHGSARVLGARVDRQARGEKH